MPSSPAVWSFYRDEMLALGKPDPGLDFPADTGMFHLAHDRDKGWAQIAPYAMHEVNMYGEWMQRGGVGGMGGYEPISDADALRETGQYRVVTPDDLVAELEEKGPLGFAMFHPLMGGIPPELAWASPRVFEHEVLPRLSAP